MFSLRSVTILFLVWQSTDNEAPGILVADHANQKLAQMHVHKYTCSCAFFTADSM